MVTRLRRPTDERELRWTTSSSSTSTASGWSPLTTDTLAVINPATEQPIESIAMGGADDVDAAVAAAKAAFETFSLTTKDERLALLDAIIGVYAGRMEELADIISQEVGAPLWLAQAAQAAAGLGHLATARARARRLRVRAPDGHHAHRPGADRRRRDDHALELAAEPDRLQGGARRSPPAARWCSSRRRSRR